MKKITLYLILLFIVSCQSQQDKIKGEWKIENLSEYPLSLINNGNITFTKSSKVLFDNFKMTIIFSEANKENVIYNYEIDNGELVIWYSDYGIPLRIKKLSKKKPYSYRRWIW